MPHKRENIFHLKKRAVSLPAYYCVAHLMSGVLQRLLLLHQFPQGNFLYR